MSVRVRQAIVGDLAGVVRLKERLALSGDDARGGFLLGVPPGRYAALIAGGCVSTAVSAGEVAGFAVVLPDPLLRASDLWARREAIAWALSWGPPPDDEPVAYFDQLALSPDLWRGYAVRLATAGLAAARASGARWLFATTVAAPVANTAALSLLRGVGGQRVGQVRETYASVGQVISHLYRIDLAGPAVTRAFARAARQMG